MGGLTREQLRAFTKRRYKVVAIPGLGEVRIQSLTELERSEDEAEIYLRPASERQEAIKRMRARSIQRALVDDEGNRIFSDSKKDLEDIMAMDSAVTNVLSDEIESHCGYLPPTAAEMEALEKN